MMENIEAPTRVRVLPVRRVSQRALWLTVDVVATAAFLLHVLS